MNIDLSGKRVIVTGASRGIGAAIAEAFAREGASVAICSRTETVISSKGKALRELGAKDVIARPVDVGNSAEVRAFVSEVAGQWGGVDVLRDKRDGRIYIVDANKTDMGPPVAMPLGQKLRSTRYMARKFRASYGPK